MKRDYEKDENNENNETNETNEIFRLFRYFRITTGGKTALDEVAIAFCPIFFRSG